METKKLGQDPAFPVAAFDANGNMTTPEDFNGISKRLYIATMAMQGLLANPNRELRFDKLGDFVNDCYDYADELLKQESK